MPCFSIKAEAATRNRYPVTCRSHKCMKVFTVLPTKVYLHASEPVQPEVLDSVDEMLRKLLADTAPARILRPPVPLLPRTSREPIPSPGFHLHPLPRLATVAGVVIATDAGTLGAKERREARGVEAIPDEGPGMTAAGVSSDPQGGQNTASIRALATAQEGEATALLHHVLSVSQTGDTVWIVVDSEAAAHSLRSYFRGRKTGGTMKELYAQHLDGQEVRLTASINVVVTPSPQGHPREQAG